MVPTAVQPNYRARFGQPQALLVLLMFGFSVMSYFDRTIMSIAGPEIMKEFAISPTKMGWVFSAFILAYAVCMIPGGHVADRLGPRNTLTLMGLSAAIFTALTPLGGNAFLAFLGVVPLLIAIRGGLGVVSAPLYPACARMCAAWVPAVHQGRVQAFIIAGACLGGAASPLIITWLMLRYGWRGSFYIAAVATAVLTLLWSSYVRGLPRGVEHSATPRADAHLWRRLLINRNLALLTFAYFTLGYFEYIFFYWIYYYFGEVRHTGFQQSARYTTVIFLTMMVMMPVGGWVSDRLTQTFGPKLGRRAVPIVGLTMGALLLYLGVSAESSGASTVLLALAIGFTSMCEGPFWALAIDIGGGQVGAAGGILNAGGNVGGFFSPVLTPLVAGYAGWSWGLYAGSVMVLLGAVSCWFVDPPPEGASSI
jgi:ACS family glucarate transporter-like MFS transporter